MTPHRQPQLEDRLAQVPRRGLPSDLRAACLAQARSETAHPTAPAAPEPRRRTSPWFAWLWPHPAAWAGLAAAWCAILALRGLAPVPINILAATGPSTPLVLDPDATRQLVLQREAREESLRPLLPPAPLDIDRPRNPAPPSTNRIA